MKNIKFYQVGGSVRDDLLGFPSKDIDYSVEAPSFEAMKSEIVNRGGEIFLEKPEYLTIRANVPNMGACDYVLCRKDGAYYDGRRPESVEIGTIRDDLARRDFTVNAMAINEDGELIDPHGGEADLNIKKLRCVGNAHERFNEDYLRMLRAIRFCITKGFGMDYSVTRAIETLSDNILLVAPERIREELIKCFAYDTAETIAWLKHFDLIVPLFTGLDGFWLKPTFEKKKY